MRPALRREHLVVQVHRVERGAPRVVRSAVDVERAAAAASAPSPLDDPAVDLAAVGRGERRAPRTCSVDSSSSSPYRSVSRARRSVGRGAVHVGRRCRGSTRRTRSRSPASRHGRSTTLSSSPTIFVDVAVRRATYDVRAAAVARAEQHAAVVERTAAARRDSRVRRSSRCGRSPAASSRRLAAVRRDGVEPAVAGTRLRAARRRRASCRPARRRARRPCPPSVTTSSGSPPPASTTNRCVRPVDVAVVESTRRTRCACRPATTPA